MSLEYSYKSYSYQKECNTPITNKSKITQQQKWNDNIISTKTSRLATIATPSISAATVTTNFQSIDPYYSVVSALSAIFRGFVNVYRIQNVLHLFIYIFRVSQGSWRVLERDFRGFTVLESLAKGFGDFQKVSERFQQFSHDFKQFLRF